VANSTDPTNDPWAPETAPPRQRKHPIDNFRTPGPPRARTCWRPPGKWTPCWTWNLKRTDTLSASNKTNGGQKGCSPGGASMKGMDLVFTKWNSLDQDHKEEPQGRGPTLPLYDDDSGETQDWWWISFISFRTGRRRRGHALIPLFEFISMQHCFRSHLVRRALQGLLRPLVRKALRHIRLRRVRGIFQGRPFLDPGPTQAFFTDAFLSRGPSDATDSTSARPRRREGASSTRPTETSAGPAGSRAAPRRAWTRRRCSTRGDPGTRPSADRCRSTSKNGRPRLLL